MGERLVRIKWSDPMTLDDVLQLNGNDDYGVYQVYGHHVVFGPGSLLYIGMAREQSFADRFKQHLRDWLQEENDVSVRVGRIKEEDTKSENDWTNVLADVEALSIYWHSPPYNSRNIESYSGIELRIQNLGNRGSVLPEFSSHWSATRPKDSELG